MMIAAPYNYGPALFSLSIQHPTVCERRGATILQDSKIARRGPPRRPEGVRARTARINERQMCTIFLVTPYGVQGR